MTEAQARPRVGLFHPGTQHSHDTALALLESGLLAWFATGIYYRPNRWPYRALEYLPSGLRRRLTAELSRRRTSALDECRILTYGFWEWALVAGQRLAPLPRLERSLIRHRNRAFGRWVAGLLTTEPIDLLYGYDTASLAAFQAAAALGIPRVLDVPLAGPRHCVCVLEEEVAEHGDFGGEHLLQELAAQRNRIPTFERELAVADLVLVGSPFAASTVEAVGGYPGTIAVVPYTAPSPQIEYHERPSREDITILHAGQISSRKGVYYLLEALRKLRNPRLKLLLVGHVAVDKRALGAYGDLFTHVPHVPRAELPAIYNSADIFVLASLAEGFARAQIEAAVHGLPIICTTATGGDQLLGEEAAGFLVPPRDVDALAERIDQLASDRALRLRMGYEAWRRAQDFTFEAYRQRLTQALAIFSPRT